jgi:hypothetical protein
VRTSTPRSAALALARVNGQSAASVVFFML